MEMILEKISFAASSRSNILDIYTVGERIQQAVDICSGSTCDCVFLQSLNNLLADSHGELLPPDQKLRFHNLCIENKKKNLLYDQINKKFGDEIFTIELRIFKVVIFFEIEKIKIYLDVLEKLEKLEGNLYIFSKSFF